MNLLQPQVPSDLTVAEDLLESFQDEDALSELSVEYEALTGLHTKSISLSESLITKSDFSLMHIDHFDIAHCLITGTNLSSSKFPESSWRSVTIDGSRCMGCRFNKAT